MQPPASALQALIDLGLSLVKLLGRPVVQMQLLAAVFALGLAWLLARWTKGALHRRHEALVALTRERLIADEQARQIVEQGNVEAATGELPGDTSGIEAAVSRRPGARRWIYPVALQVLFPLLAVVLLYAAHLLFVALGWYAGLLGDLAVILAIFLLYRLALGLAYAFGNPQRVRHYQLWLFTPLIAVLLAWLFVDGIVDLEPLAASAVVPLEGGSLTLGAAFAAVFGFYVWIMGLSLAKELLLSVAARRGRYNVGSLKAGFTLVQYGLVVLGFFYVARAFQLSTTIIAAVSGGLAVGVGFALEDVIKNFLGGIIVLFEGSVRPGDRVEIAGVEGEVADLSIRSTLVRTFDNVEYIVPNQDWLSSTVTTYTRTSRRVRARVPIGVSYNADPHVVQQLLLETARSHPDVLSDPAPSAPLVEFGDSSVNFEVRAWVEDAEIRGRVAGELRLLIWDAFKANGIEIPYPQRDLHIRSGLP